VGDYPQKPLPVITNLYRLDKIFGVTNRAANSINGSGLTLTNPCRVYHLCFWKPTINLLDEPWDRGNLTPAMVLSAIYGGRIAFCAAFEVTTLTTFTHPPPI
jgi:hypothetical protein